MVWNSRSGAGGSADVDALLASVARRDERAFARLYDATSPRVFGLVVRTLRDPRLSEDVVQEVYLQVWERAGDFDRRRGSAMAWLLMLAHRRAVDRVRREAGAERRDERAASIAATEPPHPDPADEVADSDARSREASAVTDCLEILTRAQRASITLAYFDGLTYREVASHLEVALPTVKSRIRDGLRKLKDCLGVTER